ncbi:hypothetical protein ACJ41O_014704 [Fusarium nematophilum]
MLLSNPLAVAAATLSILSLPATSATELLEGYGRPTYLFPCGSICRQCVPTTMDCPEYVGMTDEERANAYPPATCMANDTYFLTSIAWCINERCDKTVMSYKIAEFWETDMIYGLADEGGVLRYSYGAALAQVDPKKPPSPPTPEELVLNRTVGVDDATWLSYSNAVKSYQVIGKNSSKYSLLVFLSGVVMPVGFSLLRLLPIPTKLRSKFYAYLIDPPAWGKKHSVPVLGLGFIPTRGQMIFILYLIAVNAVACFEGYPNYSPNGYFPNRRYELMRHIGNRCGVIAFANIPLVILYGGRNSLLLWLTNWSHSTFLLLHRWVATLCTLEVCVHSLLWLRIMVEADSHAVVVKYPYWYWGIIGTVSFSLLIPLSVYYFRAVMYEVFLIVHIFLAIMAIVGSWYHVWYLFTGTGGYDIWLYISMAVWSYDRFLRIIRVSKHGIKRAYVTRVDDEYLRVDIPGVDCHGYCYAYFPTVSWRMWENHPFSVVGCNPGQPRNLNDPHSTSHSDSEGPSLSPTTVMDPASKEAGIVTSRARTMATRNDRQHGITLFIRPHSGLTKLLAKKAGVEAGIPVLIEATYGHEGKTYLQGSDSHFAPTPEYPNVLCLAGGVGVTAVLPALNSSLSLYAPLGTTKLYWGIRSRGLVDAVESMIVGAGVKAEDISDTNWGHIEPHITVGSRINVKQVLQEELEHAVGGTTVVVCGPLAMCDDARNTCAGLARHGTVVRYMEEACTW